MPSVIFHQPAGAEGLSPFPSRPATSQRKSPKLDGPPATNGIQHTREWDLERDKWDLEHGSGIWSTGVGSGAREWDLEHGRGEVHPRTRHVGRDWPCESDLLRSATVGFFGRVMWDLGYCILVGYCLLGCVRVHAQIEPNACRLRSNPYKTNALGETLSDPSSQIPSSQIQALGSQADGSQPSGACSDPASPARRS
eukprot:CAMPEP_0181210030 /NCGR_PEP_ID=MMETSP1096-20121128/23006_1 /TAXON_ID=156174 ORGANISM="Chrysochromulina ericina, Strain CCMP281" /NCGR_SAMPLE_ID=MMETSP1096 /ASSEMBLY_ACC=CAM_ASM_000453 /LENGTH=195 /DNA_ID=CAMNT_0023301279 /DNA_START=358 /DNA_END=942 /DNA_ORIENTATION=+